RRPAVRAPSPVTDRPGEPSRGSAPGSYSGRYAAKEECVELSAVAGGAHVRPAVLGPRLDAGPVLDEPPARAAVAHARHRLGEGVVVAEVPVHGLPAGKPQPVGDVARRHELVGVDGVTHACDGRWWARRAALYGRTERGIRGLGSMAEIPRRKSSDTLA